MTKLEDDAKALADYARAPVRHVPRAATVTPLNPPQPPTLQDKILSELDQLAADIRSGKVTPLHLILSYGDDREDYEAYFWCGVGLDRFEMIGRLTAEAAQLAVENDK